MLAALSATCRLAGAHRASCLPLDGCVQKVLNVKNNKIIEYTVPAVLILSIVVELIILGLSYTTLFSISPTNSGASSEALASLQIGGTLFNITRILLIILVILQFIFVVYVIQYKEKLCPKCQTPLPKWRVPKNAYEAIMGGWTCPSCGTKLTWQLHERK